MRKTFLIFISFVFLGCGNTQVNNTTNEKVDSEKQISYDKFKNLIKNQKSAYQNKSSKEISNYVFDLINNDIYSYWKGTVWNFNGTTQQPKEGTIACGFFVTNTLSDLGFDIQSVKLAQSVSSKMIKTLCVDIHHFSDFDKFQDYLEEQPDKSVFIVGLDCHTGYILKENAGIYFSHSNYIGREGVIKEKIEKSRALQASNTFMIGNLTANIPLLKKWISN